MAGVERLETVLKDIERGEEDLKNNEEYKVLSSTKEELEYKRKVLINELFDARNCPEKITTLTDVKTHIDKELERVVNELKLKMTLGFLYKPKTEQTNQ